MKRTTLKISLTASILLLTFVCGFYTSQILSQPETIIVEKNSIVETATYIVYINGSTINAQNGTTGAIEFSGTDASAVIQHAIDALGTNGGKVLIREGTYNITTTINIQSRAWLEGVGYATELKQANPNGTDIIRNKSFGNKTDTDITISNLRINGNHELVTSGSPFGINLYRVVKAKITENYVHNFPHGFVGVPGYSRPIHFWETKKSIVSKNYLWNNSYSDIFLAVNANYNIITDNIIETEHRGIYTWQSRWVTITNNYIHGTGAKTNKEGIRIYKDIVAGSSTMSNNILRNLYTGIQLAGTTDNRIIGNIIEDCTNPISYSGTGNIIKSNQGYFTDPQTGEITNIDTATPGKKNGTVTFPTAYPSRSTPTITLTLKEVNDAVDITSLEIETLSNTEFMWALKVTTPVAGTKCKLSWRSEVP